MDGVGALGAGLGSGVSGQGPLPGPSWTLVLDWPPGSGWLPRLSWVPRPSWVPELNEELGRIPELEWAPGLDRALEPTRSPVSRWPTGPAVARARGCCLERGRVWALRWALAVT